MAAAERVRAAELGARDALVPTSEVDADGAGFAVDETPRFLDPGGLGVEVQVAADLGGSVDGGGGPAHDVDAIRRADGGWIVAGIVQASDAAEVRLAGRAPDIEGPGDAEEGLREAAGRQRDQLVDVAHVEAVHHLGADRGNGPWRLQQRLIEAEHGLHRIARQAAEIADHHDLFDGLGGAVGRRFLLRGSARHRKDQYRGNPRGHACKRNRVSKPAVVVWMATIPLLPHVR